MGAGRWLSPLFAFVQFARVCKAAVHTHMRAVLTVLVGSNGSDKWPPCADVYLTKAGWVWEGSIKDIKLRGVIGTKNY